MRADAVSFRSTMLAALIACAATASAEKLAITFDDLPLNGALSAGTSEADLVKQTLPILAARNVPPVFGFLNARKVESNPQGTEALRLWVEGNQRLGNHTYSHLDLHANSVEDFGRDILRNEPLLALLSPRHEWRWFRYPYLREGEALEKREGARAFLAEHRYTIAQTTIDYEDYLWNSPYARCADKRDIDAIARLETSYLDAALASIAASRAMARAAFGRDVNHVLLLHLGAFTPRILPSLLDLLDQHGFELVTLEEAQTDPIYLTDPQYLGRRGGTLLEQHVQARQLQGIPWPTLPRAQLDAICR